MSFLKNRTVLGIICIVVSLVICFAITPLFNASVSQKAEIVRVMRDVKTGEMITKDMVQTVEVGGFNLPDNVVKNLDTAIGKYAVADLMAGDYILAAKLSDTPAAEDAYLYSLNGDKQAISVTVKTFANGLSGKLISGDMSEEKIYKISIRGELVEVNRELYLYFYRSRRRLDYYEHDIKAEVAIRDENGEIIGYMPSKEDSLDRIIESGADFSDDGESIEDLVIRKLMAEKLKQCLLLLEPDERRLIDELYFNERTERQLAQMFNISQPVLHKRKVRMLKKLKNYLEI